MLSSYFFGSSFSAVNWDSDNGPFSLYRSLSTLCTAGKECSPFYSVWGQIERKQKSLVVLSFFPYTVKIGLTNFPFPAGKSLTKLSLAGNNLILPGQGEFGKWHHFLQCTLLPPVTKHRRPNVFQVKNPQHCPLKWRNTNYDVVSISSSGISELVYSSS